MTDKLRSAQNAMDKAMELHPAVFYAGRNKQRGIAVWLVEGSKGADYAVYEQGEGANYRVACTCKAGENGFYCYHKQRVLLAKIERDAADAFNAALDASIASVAPVCEMCQQEPASDFSAQPRCAACVRICERVEARKAARFTVRVNERGYCVRDANGVTMQTFATREAAQMLADAFNASLQREAALLASAADAPFSLYKPEVA